MSGRRLNVVPRVDFLERVGQAPPLDSLEELIWNGLDERARSVEVTIEEADLGGVKSIRIADDGAGLPHADAEAAFTNLGESNKKARFLENGEPLHGRRGEGRFKAFSLGRQVVWEFTYARDGGLFTYRVTGTKGQERPFYLSDEAPAKVGVSSGCIVTITQPEKSLNVLLQDDAVRTLTRKFAPFLFSHRDRSITYRGAGLRPEDVVIATDTLPRVTVEYEMRRYDISAQVIQWDVAESLHEIHLCGPSAKPLHTLIQPVTVSDCRFSAFIQSDLLQRLHDENLLTTLDRSGDAQRKDVFRAIRGQLDEYFREKQAQDAQDTIARLKEEGSYPYSKDPASAVERVERTVFDICTVKISANLPSFKRMEPQGRELLLKMIREALASSPSTVGKIIREVLKLQPSDAEKFASLLEDVPLSKVVSAAHLVKQRLDFLVLFEAVVTLDPFEKTIAERTQLQKLLAGNVWLFGEEYAIGTDDENLRALLERHVAILGRDSLQPGVSEAEVKRIITEHGKPFKKTPISLDRIPDLMVWKKYLERRPDEYEFVVIEIKRPGVPVGREQVAQIRDYARAVMSSPFADKHKTRWVFIVISDSLTEEVDESAHQTGLPAYTIHRPEGKNFEIRAYPWSAVIRSARARHQYLKDEFEHDVTLERAKETLQAYREYIPGSSTPMSGRAGTRKRKGGASASKRTEGKAKPKASRRAARPKS